LSGNIFSEASDYFLVFDAEGLERVHPCFVLCRRFISLEIRFTYFSPKAYDGIS